MHRDVSLSKRIFAVLFNHDSGYYLDDTTMACCFCGDSYDENGKQMHQADALIRELPELNPQTPPFDNTVLGP